jgi:large conductance mechanosensitive channel
MSMISEFKEFVNRGNVMDMAVGVIIGGAFTGIVTALTDDVIQPIIKLAAGGAPDVSGLYIPGTEINIGAFFSAIINFFIVSLIVFAMVKSMNKLQAATAAIAGAKEEAEAPAPLPTCPFCLEEVKVGATRCPHCGGSFDKPAGSDA